MRSYARRKRRKDILGAALLIVAVVAVVVAIYLYRRLRQSPIVLDPVTLCPVNGPRSLTVVLIDATDPLDAVQKQDVNKRLDDIKNDVPSGGELELFTVRPFADGLLQPELTVCNPGRGSEISPISGNPRLVQKRWRTKFANKIDEVLTRLLNGQPANTSPILESVQQVGVQTFLGRDVERIPKKLVIVSDLIQHTSGLSQYHHLEPFEDFRQTSYYLRVRTNLAGVDVIVLYLRRPQPPNLQGRHHIEFWQKYFQDSGATVSKVVSVQG